MTTDEGQKKGFTFYADINNDSSFDISISLMLTERTLVSEVDGRAACEEYPGTPAAGAGHPPDGALYQW
ncbi:tail protein [Escherichia coli]|nr:tail protein [Escherichia coli]